MCIYFDTFCTLPLFKTCKYTDIFRNIKEFSSEIFTFNILVIYKYLDYLALGLFYGRLRIAAFLVLLILIAIIIVIILIT